MKKLIFKFLFVSVLVSLLLFLFGNNSILLNISAGIGIGILLIPIIYHSFKNIIKYIINSDKVIVLTAILAFVLAIIAMNSLFSFEERIVVITSCTYVLLLLTILNGRDNSELEEKRNKYRESLSRESYEDIRNDINKICDYITNHLSNEEQLFSKDLSNNYKKLGERIDDYKNKLKLENETNKK